jgi:hypothetical protein
MYNIIANIQNSHFSVTETTTVIKTSLKESSKKKRHKMAPKQTINPLKHNLWFTIRQQVKTVKMFILPYLPIRQLIPPKGLWTLTLPKG